VSAEGIWEEIGSVQEKTRRRALYIHVPFCIARCLFCPFYQSRTNHRELTRYTEYVLRELEMVKGTVIGQSMPVHAVYLGGGTPTDLSAEDLGRITGFVRDSFPLANDCEVTVEGRLHGFTDDKVEACLQNGVNRFSFGVQSFDTRIRRQMGRIDDRESLIGRIEEISSPGRAMITVDLIYGLPDQTRDLWLEDLETVSSTPGIDSASIYSLRYIPGSPIREMVENGKLSSPASMVEKASLFRLTREFLGSRECKRLGLRHWAFGNRERSIYNFIPRYNGSIIPVGNGAGGRLAGYSIYQKMDADEYFKRIDRGEKPITVASRVSEHSRFEGKVAGCFEEFRMVNLSNLEQELGDDTVVSRLSPLLEQWDTAGMVEWDGTTGVVRMTEAGEFHNVRLIQNLIEYNALSISEGKAGSSSPRLSIEEKVAQAIHTNPGAFPASIARDLGIPERDVVRYLPEGMSREVPGREFEAIWEVMATWERVTVIVTNDGMIAEVPGKLSSGSTAQGYFNLSDEDAPLHGHIRAELIDSIFFVSKKVMGMDSHSVQFFDGKGDKVLSVYLGRDEEMKIIPSVLDSYTELRASYES
jgi:oxygen-independent coproporphyrinogen-3 oxidase